MKREIVQTRTYYDKNAELWSVRKTHSFHHEKNFTAFAGYLKKAHVLDIGCANGIHVPLFLGIGRHLKYTGIDISKAFLKIARRRYPQLSFLEGNIADKNTLPKMKFDGFLAIAVLMHVPFLEWEQMFQNIERVSKPGAVGYIALPTEHPSGSNPEHDPRHFTILKAEEQEKYLKKQGWKILKKGILDGFTKEQIWRWYIVKLP